MDPDGIRNQFGYRSRKEKKIVQISRFEMLDVLFGGWRLLL
jgi:hypothetical protein